MSFNTKINNLIPSVVSRRLTFGSSGVKLLNTTSGIKFVYFCKKTHVIGCLLLKQTKFEELYEKLFLKIRQTFLSKNTNIKKLLMDKLFTDQSEVSGLPTMFWYRHFCSNFVSDGQCKDTKTNLTHYWDLKNPKPTTATGISHFSIGCFLGKLRSFKSIWITTQITLVSSQAELIAQLKSRIFPEQLYRFSSTS